MTLVWASGYNGITDPDAQTYIAAVEAADGQAIEGDVALAINDFVVGCKLDGIWDAIKASCILAGARTLAGALVPLVGTAPTNFNFVSGDYDRETGLKGNSSTKYLDSNRNNNADPQNNQHLSVFVSENATGTNTHRYISGRGYFDAYGASLIGKTSNNSEFYSQFDLSGYSSFALFSPGTFTGISRSSSPSFSYRLNGTTNVNAVASYTPANINIHLFRNPGGDFQSDARLSFYSIGESLDLALLDNRVSTLMTDIGAAIP